MAFVRIDLGGRVAFARAALPNPVYIPGTGPVGIWPTPGPLIGVFDAAFPTATGRLSPGDKLLFATGGEDLLALAERHRMSAAATLADAAATAETTTLVFEFVG
jgi:hypothetical protein